MSHELNPVLQVTIAILFLVLLIFPDLLANNVDLEGEESDRIDIP
jgi:hypothetical protein